MTATRIQLLKNLADAKRAVIAAGITATENIVGGIGEELVARATGGTVMPNSHKGFDVQHPTFGRIEVKTRRTVQGEPITRFGDIRRKVASSSFDTAAFVVLDDDFRVVEGWLIPIATLSAQKRPALTKATRSAEGSIDITALLKGAE